MQGYNRKLSKEWIDWVETPNPDGTRESEIFDIVRKWLEDIKPEILVDIGCGQGQLSEVVDSTKIKYIGIDPSLTLIKRANELYSSDNIKFMEGNAYDLPLESKSVDSSISIWVWSHLEGLNLAAKEMYRILEVGGKILIITANPETYEERKTFYSHYSISGNLLKGTFDLGNGRFLTDTTLYLHSIEDIEQAIKQAGFKIDNIHRIGKAETSNDGLYLVINGSK